MWSQPKVTWQPTDYFNIEDWQRIRSNLEHIHSWLQNAGVSKPRLLDTDTGRGYAELPYVYLVNNMEENLANLQKVFGVSPLEDTLQKTWYMRVDIRYISNPTYADWNRWETILLYVSEWIQYIDSYVFTPISGTCRSGSERTLLRFSRGR